MSTVAIAYIDKAENWNGTPPSFVLAHPLLSLPSVTSLAPPSAHLSCPPLWKAIQRRVSCAQHFSVLFIFCFFNH